jgi:hypothetical protein
MSTPAAPTREPWDQRPDEAPAAYARFLTYRNLGPTRSLDAAYQIYGGAPVGAKKPKRRPGSWQRECRDLDWTARAEAWDVSILSKSSARVAVAIIQALEAASVKVLAGLLEPGSKPKGWSEQLEGLMTLLPYVPPEVVKTVEANRKVAVTTIVQGYSDAG